MSTESASNDPRALEESLRRQSEEARAKQAMVKPANPPPQEKVHLPIVSSFSSVAAAQALNPTVQLNAQLEKFRGWFREFADAISPGHGGQYDVTDLIHIATNARVQGKADALNLHTLIKLLTGGPLNLKVAMERAKEAGEMQEKLDQRNALIIALRGQLGHALPEGVELPELCPADENVLARTLRAEVDGLEAVNEKLRSDVRAANATVDSLRSEIAGLQNQLTDLTAQLDLATQPVAPIVKGKGAKA